MVRIKLIPLPDYTNTKRLIMLLGVVFAAVVPFISLIGPIEERLAMVVMSVLFGGFLAYVWAYFDSLEVGEQLQPVMGISLIFFNIISLCVYLILSRGIRYGARAVGKAFLLLAVMFLVSASIFQILEIRVW